MKVVPSSLGPVLAAASHLFVRVVMPVVASLSFAELEIF